MTDHVSQFGENAPPAISSERRLGRAARRLLLAGLALPLLPLTSCSSDDPQEQRVYYSNWLHPEGSPGVGSNPFKKEFWVGNDE